MEHREQKACLQKRAPPSLRGPHQLRHAERPQAFELVTADTLVWATQHGDTHGHCSMLTRRRQTKGKKAHRPYPATVHRHKGVVALSPKDLLPHLLAVALPDSTETRFHRSSTSHAPQLQLISALYLQPFRLTCGQVAPGALLPGSQRSRSPAVCCWGSPREVPLYSLLVLQGDLFRGESVGDGGGDTKGGGKRDGNEGSGSCCGCAAC